MQPSVDVPRETRRETIPLRRVKLKSLGSVDQDWLDRVPDYPLSAQEADLSVFERTGYRIDRTLRASAAVHGISLGDIDRDDTRTQTRARLVALFLLNTWFRYQHQKLADLVATNRTSVTRAIDGIKAELKGPGRVLPLTLAAIVDEMIAAECPETEASAPALEVV